MDAETRQKLEKVEEEARQGESDLVKQVLKDCEEFKKLQQQVEEESEAERKRALEEIELKAKADDEKYQAQLEEIKNYEITEPNNPQQEEETEEEQEARKMREKFLAEIQAAGEEQVKVIESRLGKYAELDQKLAEIAITLNKEKPGDETEIPQVPSAMIDP